MIEKERLFHLDRIIIGTSTIFLFKDYDNADFKRIDIEEKDLDLEYCQTELFKKTRQMDQLEKNVEDDMENTKKEEIEKKLKEQEEKLQQYKIMMENTELESQRTEVESNAYDRKRSSTRRCRLSSIGRL